MKKNTIDIKNIAYIVLLSFLIIHLIFYTFVGSKTYMNGDSTFIIDYSVEQIKTGKIFPENYIHANDFWIYSLIPILTPLIKLGCNFLLSRQIAVFVQSVLLILLVIDLFGREIKDKTGLKIALILLLSSISGQFVHEIFGDASYGTVVFYMLLEMLLFIKILKENSKYKILYLVFFSVILIFITACSLRFPIYLGAPLICVLLYLIYRNNGLKKEYIAVGLAIVISILIGFLENRYLTMTNNLETNYKLNFIVETNKSLDTNSSYMTYNYLQMCGSTFINTKGLQIEHYNDDIFVSSPLVALTFCRFIFAIVSLIIPFVLLKHIKEMKFAEIVLLLFSLSLLILITFFLLIGGMAWWNRYIAPVVFFLTLLYPLCYRYIFSNENRKKVVFAIFMVLCVISSLYFVITSYFDYNTFTIRENEYQSSTDFLLSNNLNYGYTYYIGSNIFYTLSEGKIRAFPIDVNGTSIRRWQYSTDYLGTDYYNGKVFLIKDKRSITLPVEAVASKSYIVDRYKVLIFDSNEIFLKGLEDLKFDENVDINNINANLEGINYINDK
ncbi:MAG: hypothetical protein IKI57_02580 [Clostridia bacterium]|nr:hypothetical protein [Clostridia bacterium]